MHPALPQTDPPRAPFGVRAVEGEEETQFCCLWFCGWAVGNAAAAVLFATLVMYLARAMAAQYFTLMTPTVWGAYALAVGGLAYYAASGLFNRTWITYRDERITVRQGPLPWLGNRMLPTAAVQRVRVRSEEHRSRNLRWQVHYLEAMLYNGKPVVLLSGVFPASRFEFLRQKLQQRLDTRGPAEPPGAAVLAAAEHGQFTLRSLFAMMALVGVLLWLATLFFTGREGLLVGASLSLLAALLFCTHGDVLSGVAVGWIVLGLPALAATMLPRESTGLMLADPLGRVLFCLATTGLFAGSLQACRRHSAWLGCFGIASSLCLMAGALSAL